MSDNEKLSVIIKVMKLVRLGKVTASTKNIDVLRMINKEM